MVLTSVAAGAVLAFVTLITMGARAVVDASTFEAAIQIVLAALGSNFIAVTPLSPICETVFTVAAGVAFRPVMQ